MTFSQTVKGEILKSVRRLNGCCATSFLTAVIKSIGSLELSFGGGFSFSIQSDNHDLLTFCKALADEQLHVGGEIESTNSNAKGTPVYVCTFQNNIGQKLGLCRRDADGTVSLCDDVQLLLPKKACCKRAFLQGLMVACGSVVIPATEDDLGENKSGAKYHAELRFSDEQFSRAVKELYAELPFRQAARKSCTILYIKDSEAIADLLVYLNAMRAKLKLENVIIGRSLRNTANRQRNCISANIDKSVNAGIRQLEAISTLRKNGGLEQLPQGLKEAAELREQLPEATLDELAVRLGISKSGINHRLSKIVELAERYEKDKAIKSDANGN